MTRFTWTLPAVAAVLAVAVTAGILLLGGSAARATAPPTLSTAQIDTDALSLAAQLGDSSPSLIQHVSGTRATENQIASGEVVGDGTPSILIAMRGNFVDTAASVPQNDSAPSGTVVTMIVDTATNTITDLGVGNNYPDLGAVGPVTTDSTSAEQSASMLKANQALRTRP